MLSDGSLFPKCSASLADCNEKVITTLYIKMLFMYSHFLQCIACTCTCRAIHVHYMYVCEECYVRKRLTTFAVNDVVMSFFSY